MKFIFLSIFLLALSCGSPKNNTSTKEELKTDLQDKETVVEETIITPEVTAADDELIVVLSNPKKVEEAKALIKNSGLQWKKTLMDNETAKIALIKVPKDKCDFWLERLQKVGEFKSVEANGVMSIEKAIEKEKNTLVSLRKTQCFGDCPVYDVFVDVNGKVTYNGKQYVIEEGVHEFELSEEEFSKLKEILNKKDFANFKEVYDNPRIMDLPSTYIAYKGKQVQIRLWSDDIPKELIDVNEYLEGILLKKKFFN